MVAMIVTALLCALWITFAVVAKRKRKSLTIAIGGGFLAACVASVVVAYGYAAITGKLSALSDQNSSQTRAAAAAPAASGAIRQAVTLDYSTDSDALDALLSQAYEVATDSPAVTSICFTVSVSGQDHYGKPKTVSMGAVTFDAAQVAELRKYASAQALVNDGTNDLGTFGNVFTFVDENSLSPYTQSPGLAAPAPQSCGG
jgi:hypothetical protein